MLTRILVICMLLAVSVAAWETKIDALSQAVDLVRNHDFGIAFLSTKYASGFPTAELADQIITGPEYFAPCDTKHGNLLFLGLTVSQTWRNVINSPEKNATISIGSNADPNVPDPRHREHHKSDHWQRDRPQWRRGMPSKSRATFFGHFDLTNATEHPSESQTFAKCYLHHHPDASHWSPGSKASPHVPFWATFVVNKIYWVGGFGDEHYIGWFNQTEWNAAWASAHDPNFTDKEGAQTYLAYAQLFGSSDDDPYDSSPKYLQFQ